MSTRNRTKEGCSIKILIGGSPCTHWSIAQTKHRETAASGVGWELFRNYVIARDKYQPDYFLYENNKSMSAAIREQITKELGVEPVLINSALVSAQNRQRLYWVGKREPDGTYSQVQIEQPEDRGILLRDILETGLPLREKAYALLSAAHSATAEDAIARRQRNAAAETVQIKPLTEREMEYMVRETSGGRNHFDFDYHHDATRDKSSCVTANTHRGVPYNVLVEPVDGEPEPAAMRQVGRRINEQGRRDDYNEAIPHFQYFEVNDNPQKTNCLSTVEKDNMVAVPVLAQHAVDAEKNQTVSRSIDEIVEKKGYLPEMFNPYNRAEIKEKAPTLSTGSMVTSSCATLVVEELEQLDAPVRIGTIENAAKNQEHDSQQYRVYSPDGKAVTLCGAGGVLEPRRDCMLSPSASSMRVPEATKLGYAEIQPGECVDLSMPSSKTRRGRAMKDKSNCLTTSCGFYEYCGTLDAPVYQVKDGKITVKGKEYPIKLRDGCYIIRKLTVTECKRLQTVPDEYEFPVSDSQAYKMLGNGWTVDVIAHIMSHFGGLTEKPVEVLSMYDGMSCGHIALDKLGAEISAYYATEIDKYAIQTTQHNFPDTVQLGDAFQVRDAAWALPTV